MAGRYDHLFSEDSATPDLGVQADISQGGRYDHLFDGLDSPEEEIISQEVAEQLPETSPLHLKPSPPVPAQFEAGATLPFPMPKPVVPETRPYSPQIRDTDPTEPIQPSSADYPMYYDHPITMDMEEPQEQPKAFTNTDLIDSLKSGSYGLAGRMLNLWADKEKAYRENPDLYMQKIAGLSPYAAIGASMMGPPKYSPDQEKLSKEKEIELLEEAEKWFKKSSDLGRPLSWKETEFNVNFTDYLVGLAGSTGPSMLAGMVTMGLASPLLLEAEVNQEIRSIPGLDSKTQLELAEAGGLIAGALEIVGLGLVVRGIPKTALAKIGVPALTKYIEKHAGKSAARKFAVEVVKKPVARGAVGFFGEAGTEASQEKTILETAKLAHEAAGQEGDLYTPEEESERLKEAFIGGGLVGGPIRGGVGAVSDARSVLEQRRSEYLGDQLSNIAALQEATRVAKPSPGTIKVPDPLKGRTETFVPEKEDFVKGLLEEYKRDTTPNKAFEPIDKTKRTTQILPSGQLTPDTRPEEELAPETQTSTVSTPLVEDVSPTEDQEPSAEETPDLEAEAKPEVEEVVEEVVEEEVETEPEPETKVEEEVKVEEEQPVEQVVEESVEQEELVGGEQKVEVEEEVVEEKPKVREKIIPPQTVKAKKLVSEGEPGFKRKAIQGTNATVVTPDGSMEVGRNLVLLDLSEVEFARDRLQGRDRGRQQSADLARNRAVKFDPAQVVESSRTSDSGPPLITPSGVILSGNGRTLTITELYDNPDLSEQKEKYLAELRKLGDIEGMERPILVQRIKTDEWGKTEKQQYEQAVKFADASNIQKVDTMSSFERAKSDGKVLKTIAHLMKSSDVKAATNSDFIQQFAAKAVSDTEAGDFFQANGRDISVSGIRRIEDALLTAAYGENETVLAALEDPADKVKSLKAAMLKTAPRFSEVANKIDKGDIPADMDIAPYIIEAVEKIKAFKETRTTLADDQRQDSLFGQEESELTGTLVDAFHNDDGTRTRSKEFITKVLTKTVDKILAQDYSAGIPGLEQFAETAPVGDILAESVKETQTEQEIKDAKAKKKKKQGELEIDEGDSATVPKGSPSGREPVRAAPQKGTKGILTRTKKISSSVREQIFVDMAEQDESMSADLDLESRIAIIRNLPPKVLAKKMQKMVEKKFRFKFVDDELPKGMQVYKQPAPPTVEVTINNMMNLYQNGEGMAAALGIPLQFMGLDGTLGLQGRLRSGKFPAWYNPNPLQMQVGGNTIFPFITITGRSQAFAHEWGHALDYHILTKLGEGWHKGAMSGRLRGKESSDAWLSNKPAPERFKFAFADLLNSLFYEHGADAAAIMDLQQKLTKARSQKVIDKYNRQIQELKEGMSKKHLDKSKFKLGAEYIGNVQGKPEYWSEPTELFARAFEAYVAHKVTLQAHTHKDTFDLNKIQLGEGINPKMPGTEYLGKPNSDYIMTEKDVSSFALIDKMFPQESDRLNIFSKFDDLFDAMADVFYKDEEAASAKEGPIHDYPTLYKPEDQGPLTTKSGWEESSAVTKRKANRWARRAERLAKRKLKYQDVGRVKNAYFKLRDLVWSTYMGSKQGNFESFQRRYPHIKEIEKIMNLVMPDPGGERFTSNTWNDAVPRELRRRAFIFKNISNKWKAEAFTEEDLKTLRLFATSDPETLAKAKRGEIDKNIMGYAEDMRKMLNSLWDYANNSHVEMNFLDKNAYLPRMIDLSLVHADQPKFLKQAKKLYKNVIWKNDHGVLDITDSDQLVSIGDIAGEKDYRDLNEEINKLAKLSKRVKRLKDEITEMEDSKEYIENKEEKIGEVQEKIDEIMAHEDTAKIITEGYEAISDAWAEAGASDWRVRLFVKAGEDPSKSSPVGGKFTKKRKLPPEADTIMVDFYLSPVDAVQSYITSLVRKVEYERLFGRHKIPVGDKRKPGSMQLRDYKEYLFDKMAEKGVHENDIQMMRYDLDGILGRTAPIDTGTMKTLNTFHSFSLMALLPRAVATSLPEPFVAGIKMRSTMKGLKTFIHTLDELLGKVNKDAAQRTQLKKQIGAILGVYDDPDIGEMMAERMGGHLADDPRNQERMNTFFVRTALQGVTNAQRRATMMVSFQYLRELGDQYNNPVGMSKEAIAQNKKAAELELMDLGIPENKLKEFSEYMTNVYKNNVSPDSLMLSDGTLSEMAQLLSISTLRITDRSIQNPMISSRPRYAENVIGRLVYSIQSFNYSFTRNVLVSEFKRYQRDKKHLGSITANTNAAKLMGPIFQLYMGHVMVSALRMYLLDREKWEEKKEDGTLEGYVAEISFNRSGALGFIEPWYQSYRAIRYQRDLATSIVGATPGFYLQPADKIIKYFIDETNSPNTTSAEKKALEAFYTLVIVPIIVASVSNPTFLANLGPSGNFIAGMLAMVGTSKTAKTTASKAVLDLYK